MGASSRVLSVPRKPRAGRRPARAREESPLLALEKVTGPLLRVLALLLGHFQKALSLAGVLAFTGILGALAGRLTLASIHAAAMDLRVRPRDGSADKAGAEEDGGCGGKRRAGGVFQSHGASPLGK